MENRKKLRTIIEIVLVAAGVALLFAILRYHTPKVLQILETGNVSDVESYIRDEGTKGKYILILLQVIETVSIVLPALPVYICAGVLFGKLQGFLMCYLTNIVMNLIIFVVAGRLHINTDEFAKIHQNEKLQKLMSITDKPMLLVILMCLLPVVPNGMIPYVSAQTDMRLSEFMRGLAIGSLPAILFYVCCGDILLSVNYKQIIPVIIVVIVLVIIGFINRKRITEVIERRMRK